MDSHVVASSGKLYLRRDLRWVVKGVLTSTRKSQKTHFKADIFCISLVDKRLMDVTQLALTWIVWPNGEKLASTCVQI